MSIIKKEGEEERKEGKKEKKTRSEQYMDVSMVRCLAKQDHLFKRP